MRPNNEKLVSIIFLFFLLNLIIGAQDWEEIGITLPLGDSASHNAEITFSSKDNGWLFNQYGKNGENTLYKTSDGGQSWQKVRIVDNRRYYLTAVFSLEPDFFYMINSDYSFSVGYDARFTDDGGATWDSIRIQNEGFQILHFFTREKGIAMSGEHCWKTTDGGFSWNQKGVIPLSRDIFFLSENLGWAVGYSSFSTDAGFIAKTINGGLSWEYQDSSFGGMVDYFGIEFLDSLKGFAVGGSIKTTEDGGKTWSSIPDIGGYDVAFLDNRNGWISSGGNIFYTSDGGETWAAQLDNPLHYSLTKIIMLKQDKAAYILGINPNNDSATLLKADLSAITGIEDNQENITTGFHLAQNYPNPFNPSTKIKFSIPVTSKVKLTIYNMIGEEIKSFESTGINAGPHQFTWNGTNKNNEPVASGIYIYRLQAIGHDGQVFEKSSKMILLR